MLKGMLHGSVKVNFFPTSQDPRHLLNRLDGGSTWCKRISAKTLSSVASPGLGLQPRIVNSTYVGLVLYQVLSPSRVHWGLGVTLKPRQVEPYPTRLPSSRFQLEIIYVGEAPPSEGLPHHPRVRATVKAKKTIHVFKPYPFSNLPDNPLRKLSNSFTLVSSTFSDNRIYKLFRNEFYIYI